MKAKPILLFCLVTLGLIFCLGATDKSWKPPMNDKDKRAINAKTYRQLAEIELKVALKKYEQIVEMQMDLAIQREQTAGDDKSKEKEPIIRKITGLRVYEPLLVARIIDLNQTLTKPLPEPAPAADPAPAPPKTAPADAAPPGKTP